MVKDGIGKTMNDFLGPHLATPKLVPTLARNYEKHCPDKNGEVAKSLWLICGSTAKNSALRRTLALKRSRLRCSINVFMKPWTLSLSSQRKVV
jgi:hypothetical protein